MKKQLLLFVFIALSIATTAGSLPSKPTSFKGVADFAVLLSEREITDLIGVIDSLNSSNDFEIACLIIPDLGSYSIEEYANLIFEKWEIGTTKKDKGILILIKPKTTSQKGEIYITVSGNLKNKIPDVIVQSLIEDTFLRNFKNNNYFKGINDGIQTINNLGKSKEVFASSPITKKSTNRFDGSVTPIYIIGIISLIIILLVFLAGIQNRFGSKSNVLIVGVVYMIIGVVSLILRIDLLNALFGFGEMLLDSLMNQGRIKTSYYFILANSIIMIITGIILALKSLLSILKEIKSNSIN